MNVIVMLANQHPRKMLTWGKQYGGVVWSQRKSGWVQIPALLFNITFFFFFWLSPKYVEVPGTRVGTCATAVSGATAVTSDP